MDIRYDDISDIVVIGAIALVALWFFAEIVAAILEEQVISSANRIKRLDGLYGCGKKGDCIPGDKAKSDCCGNDERGHK